MPVSRLVIALFIVLGSSAVGLGRNLVVLSSLPVQIVHNTSVQRDGYTLWSVRLPYAVRGLAGTRLCGDGESAGLGPILSVRTALIRIQSRVLDTALYPSLLSPWFVR